MCRKRKSTGECSAGEAIVGRADGNGRAEHCSFEEDSLQVIKAYEPSSNRGGRSSYFFIRSLPLSEGAFNEIIIMPFSKMYYTNLKS